MIAEILQTITEWMAGFWGFVTTSITSAVEIFYIPGVDGGLTPIGILALFGVAVGVVYLGLNFVRSFFQK